LRLAQALKRVHSEAWRRFDAGEPPDADSNLNNAAYRISRPVAPQVEGAERWLAMVLGPGTGLLTACFHGLIEGVQGHCGHAHFLQGQ
jgi:hypothetical protein